MRIETAKGSYEGTLVECLEWQRERQGALALIDHAGNRVEIDDIDLDEEGDDGLTVAQAAKVIARRLARASAKFEDPGC